MRISAQSQPNTQTGPNEEPAGHAEVTVATGSRIPDAVVDIVPDQSYQLDWERPNDDVSQIQDMVTLFERSLVALVRDRLERHYGRSWLKQGCGKHLKDWRATDRASDKPGIRTKRPQDLIGYATIGELLQLITDGNNWAAFEQVFGDKLLVERHFHLILPLRNSGMHPGGRELYAAEESAGIGAMQSIAETYDQTVAQTIDESHRQLVYQDRSDDSPTVAAFAKMATNLSEVRDPHLVGRESDLRELSEFWSDEYTRVASIVGIGGVGKTALLDQFTLGLMTNQCTPSEAPDPEIFIFLTAKRNYLRDMKVAPASQRFGTVREIYEALLTAAGDEGPPNRPLDELRQAAFGIASEAPALFALDNLETLDDPDWEEVRDFLDDLPRPSKAIITTRDNRRQGRAVALTGLDTDAAIELIRKVALTHGVMLDDTDNEPLEAITKATDGVPLYLVFCGNAIGQGCSPLEALQRLQGEELINFLNFSFKSSFDTLSDEAVGLLYYLALSRESRRYQELKGICPNDELLTQSITRVRQLSFVEVTTQGKKTNYRISAPQLAEYSIIAATERLGAQELTDIRERAGAGPSAVQPANVGIEVKRAIAHAEESVGNTNWQAGVDILEETRKRWGDAPIVLDRLGTFYWKMHQRSRARDLLEKAIKGGLRSSKTFCTLGLVYLYEGEYTSAIEQAEKALNERPGYPQAELLLGDALFRDTMRTQLMISPERKKKALEEAKRHVEGAFIEDDVQGWQRRHNQIARDTLARVDQELVRTFAP